MVARSGTEDAGLSPTSLLKVRCSPIIQGALLMPLPMAAQATTAVVKDAAPEAARALEGLGKPIAWGIFALLGAAFGQSRSVVQKDRADK